MTWLADFIEREDVSRYPVALRTRGGIGFKVGRETQSFFVGHRVHFLDGHEWKPITLRHEAGQFEGSAFRWNGYAATYKKKILFQPKSITFNGIARPLNFFRDGTRFVAYVPNIGTYEIVFTENGVKEILTIPEPLEGTLSFQVHHAEKPADLYKRERRIISDKDDDQTGDTYTLTRNMTYPIVIDPDYSSDTADGRISGTSTVYATARATANSNTASETSSYVGQNFATPNYSCRRVHTLFLTSGIPDGDSITQVNMKLVCTSDGSTTDFITKIVKYDWSSYNPVDATNRETVYDGILAATVDNDWRSSSGIVTGTQYSSSNLDTAWVSKTASTYYGLISDRDIANTTPIDAEFLYFAMQEHATSSYRPVLAVTHAAAGGQNSGFFALFP